MYELIVESELPNKDEILTAIKDTYPESVSAFHMRGF